MSNIIFDPPPAPRGNTQQQLDDLRRWADMLSVKLRQLAADLDEAASNNNP